MYRSDAQPRRLCEPPEVCRRPELHSPPDRMPQPAAHPPLRGPEAPASEFADDKPSSGHEHAGDFRHRFLSVVNKAEDGHRHHDIKSCVIEGQALGATLDELDATAKSRSVICFAHVTNTMAQTDGDFEKGEADGATATLAVVTAATRAWSSAADW